MQDKRTIYARTPENGIQLASGADRWHLHHDYVHLAPHHEHGQLMRFGARRKPFVDNLNRGAVIIVDMQNDFCQPGGWVDHSGFDYTKCRQAIPGIQRTITAARRHGMWVVWVYWNNRADLRNLGPPTLLAFKHDPEQHGIGEELDNGPVLTHGSWGAEVTEDLKPYMDENDVYVEKVRLSGFYGTHLDQVLRTQGIQTLFLCGVNIDQCVLATLQDAHFHDYNPILVEDACATASPEYCTQSTVYNAMNCWGFVTSSGEFENPTPFERSEWT